MQNQRTVIRASSLPTIANCELMWLSRSFSKELKDAGFKLNRIGQGVGASVGTGAHAGSEHMLRYKNQYGELPELKDCVDYAVEEYEQTVKNGVVYDDLTKNKSVAIYQIKSSLAVYREYVAKKIDPMEIDGELQIEIRRSAELKEGIELSGQYDVLDSNGKIRDNKFGKADSNFSAQFGAYGILVLRDGIKPNKIIVEDKIARPPKDKPAQYTPVYYDLKTCISYAKNIIERAIPRVVEFKKTGNTGLFLPNPGTNLCSKNFCPAFGTDVCSITKNRKKETVND